MGSFRSAEKKPRAGTFRTADQQRNKPIRAPEWAGPVGKGLDYITDLSDRASAGLTLGLTDVAKGVAAAATPRKGQSRGEAYEEQRGADRNKRDRMGLPGVAAELVGGLGLPGAAQLTKFIGGAKGLPGVVTRSAATGAPLGAITGAAGAELGEELEGAVTGARQGALIGGAIPLAGRALAPVGKTVARAANAATGGKLLNPAREAAQQLVKALKADGATPKQIRDATNEWLLRGVSSPTLVDIAARLPNGGETVRGLVRGAAVRAGPARTAAEQHYRRTAADLQDNAISLTRKLTPEQRSAKAYKSGLRREMRGVDDQLYPAFQGDAVPVGDDIMAAVSGETGDGALRYAARIADTRRDWDALAEINALADGKAQTVSAGTLELIRRGLRDTGRKAAREGDRTIAGGYAGRQGDIETALMDIPGFDAARSSHADYMRRIEAVDEGLGGLDARPDEFEATIAGLSGGGREALGVGYRQALTDAIGRPAEGARGVLNRIGTSMNQGRNLTAAYGADAAGQYRAGLQDLMDQMNTARFVSPNTNSDSVGRLVDDMLDGKAPTGSRSWGNALFRAIGTLRRGVPLSTAEKEALVRTGLGTPNEVLQTLPDGTLVFRNGARLLPNGAFTPALTAQAGRSGG